MSQIKKAMILAAGYGKRLQPITNKIPKPLVEVGGISIINRLLNQLKKSGIEEVIVNTAHLAEKIHTHLNDFTDLKITFSDEGIPLETGGGIKKAIQFFGEDPFIAVNGDAIFHDVGDTVFNQLMKKWHPGMEVLLAIVPKKNSLGLTTPGDFYMKESNLLERRKEGLAPFYYAGAQILQPYLFHTYKKDHFSLLEIYDNAEIKGTIYGLEYDGLWFHAGTPEDLQEINDWFAKNKGE
jgi:MurNAc alpha-1-phosphate uridylyltransferase